MSVLYAPRLADLSIPEQAVVAFSIDPVACVARLKDPEATAAAALLPRHKHLAIVGMLLNVSIRKHPTRQALTLKFHYVSRGRLPDPAFACLALSEELASTLPGDRLPLLPNPLLPFTDCCVHTLDTFSARLTAIHLTDPEKVSRITSDQMKRLLETWLADAGAQHAANPVSPEVGQQDVSGSRASTPLSPVGSFPYSVTSSDSALEQASQTGSTHGTSNSQSGARSRSDVVSSEGSSDDDSDSDSDDDGGDDEDDSVSEDDDDNSVSEDDDDNDGFDPDGYLMGEIWLELSPEDEFGTAAQLIEISDRLNDIKERSRRRAMLAALADQPEMIKWAEDVASAVSLDLNPAAGRDASNGALASDDDIEHRFETSSLASKDALRGTCPFEKQSPAQAGSTAHAVVSPPPASLCRRFGHVFCNFSKRVRRLFVPFKNLARRDLAK